MICSMICLLQRIVIAVPLPPFSLVEREFWCGGIPSVVGQILPIGTIPPGLCFPFLACLGC